MLIMGECRLFKFAVPRYPEPDIKIDFTTESFEAFLKHHYTCYVGSWFGWEDQDIPPHHIFVIGGKIVEVTEDRSLEEKANEVF